MSDQEVERDIKSFFNHIRNQNIADKEESLRILLSKYMHINKAVHLMDNLDLLEIISQAKHDMSNRAFPVYLGQQKRRVHQNDQSHLCVVEATIGHLNKLNCLKRLPKFNYEEDRFEEE